jgi:hypothetical protein
MTWMAACPPEKLRALFRALVLQTAVSGRSSKCLGTGLTWVSTGLAILAGLPEEIVTLSSKVRFRLGQGPSPLSGAPVLSRLHVQVIMASSFGGRGTQKARQWVAGTPRSV